MCVYMYDNMNNVHKYLWVVLCNIRIFRNSITVPWLESLGVQFYYTQRISCRPFHSAGTHHHLLLIKQNNNNNNNYGTREKHFLIDACTKMATWNDLKTNEKML